MHSALRVRVSALCVACGLVAWWAIWSAAGSAWEGPVLGLAYEDWNRLMPAPLAVLLAGVLGLRQSSRRWVRVGLTLAAVGLVVAAAGSALEFWVAGGIRTGRGDRELSMLGWGLFLLGHLLALGGAALAVVGRWLTPRRSGASAQSASHVSG
jgi:hypothetical protein